MQINQTNIESATVKQDAAKAGGTTLNAVDDVNTVEEEYQELQSTPKKRRRSL